MLVTDMRYGDLHCRVEEKHPQTFYLFGLTKQYTRGCRLHSNEEVEVEVTVHK